MAKLVKPTTDNNLLIKLSIDDFCVRLSETDKRVEMISAFNSDERQAGRVSDTADNYASRYQVFLNKPA